MAEEGELSLLDKAKEQLGLDLTDAQLIYTGVGAINIIRSLAGLDRDAEVYNIGYAGSANFEIGIIRSVCYTNTDFVLASDYKDCVFDMELAFIASLGFKQLHSLKYVSDNLSLHTYHDLTHGVE